MCRSGLDVDVDSVLQRPLVACRPEGHSTRSMSHRRILSSSQQSVNKSFTDITYIKLLAFRMKLHTRNCRKYLIDNECDSVTARERVASQTERVSVNGVNEIEKSETTEWAGRAFITGPGRQPSSWGRGPGAGRTGRRPPARPRAGSMLVSSELITKFVKTARDSATALTAPVVVFRDATAKLKPTAYIARPSSLIRTINN